jgi:hypothetical protein
MRATHCAISEGVVMHIYGIKNLVSQEILAYILLRSESKICVGWLDEKIALDEENVFLFSLELPLDVLRADEKKVIAHVLQVTFPNDRWELDNLTLIPYTKKDAPGIVVAEISRDLH